VPASPSSKPARRKPDPVPGAAGTAIPGEGDEGWSAFLNSTLGNQAQAAFGGVTEFQAALQRAQIDAQANAARQSGDNSCPTCAQIDILTWLPSGLTTYAPGTGFSVTGQ
jgi:membrane protease subunit (stomatin/prohibitin family)